MPLKVRRITWFTGRVQGVGFRMTTKSIARSFRVAGYVKNLPDGRVELAAEGDPAEIDRFIASVTDRMGQFITATTGDTVKVRDEVKFRVER
jgi:acylphosphatase